MKCNKKICHGVNSVSFVLFSVSVHNKHEYDKAKGSKSKIKRVIKSREFVVKLKEKFCERKLKKRVQANEMIESILNKVV